MRYSFVLNAAGKAELMQIEGRYRQMVSSIEIILTNSSADYKKCMRDHTQNA